MTAIQAEAQHRWIEFLRSMSIEAYGLISGLEAHADLAAVRRRHADLFTREAVLAEERALAAATPSDQPRIALALQLRAGLFIEGKVAELTDAIGAAAAPLSSFAPAMRGTAGRAERIALGHQWSEALTTLLPTYEALWIRRWETAQSLGADYASSYLQWKQLPSAESLAAIARAILAATRTHYETLLDEVARDIVGVRREDLVWQDVPALMAGRRWDVCFPAERLVPVLHAVAARFGMRIGADEGRTLDTEVRPNKTSRPFCVGCRIPGDVRLVIRPSGGHRDFAEALHELGHLLQLSDVDPELPWEYRYVFRDAVFEAYAYQTAALPRDADFLTDVAGVAAQDVHDYIRYASLLELYMLRRYCGKVLFELRFHRSGDPAAARGIYVEELGEAVGFAPAPAHELTDLDSGVTAAEYLLAWVNEARLTAWLGGGAWFRAQGARERLRALWRRGSAAAFSAPFLSSPEPPAGTQWLAELLDHHHIVSSKEEEWPQRDKTKAPIRSGYRSATSS